MYFGKDIRIETEYFLSIKICEDLLNYDVKLKMKPNWWSDFPSEDVNYVSAIVRLPQVEI